MWVKWYAFRLRYKLWINNRHASEISFQVRLKEVPRLKNWQVLGKPRSSLLISSSFNGVRLTLVLGRPRLRLKLEFCLAHDLWLYPVDFSLRAGNEGYRYFPRRVLVRRYGTLAVKMMLPNRHSKGCHCHWCIFYPKSLHHGTKSHSEPQARRSQKS